MDFSSPVRIRSTSGARLAGSFASFERSRREWKRTVARADEFAGTASAAFSSERASGRVGSVLQRAATSQGMDFVFCHCAIASLVACDVLNFITEIQLVRSSFAPSVRPSRSSGQKIEAALRGGLDFCLRGIGDDLLKDSLRGDECRFVEVAFAVTDCASANERAGLEVGSEFAPGRILCFGDFFETRSSGIEITGGEISCGDLILAVGADDGWIGFGGRGRDDGFL